MNPRGRVGRRASVLAIAGLVVVAALLRWFGIGFLLPQWMPVDAVVLYSQVDAARGHTDRKYGVLEHLYPQLLPRLVALLPEADAELSPSRTSSGVDPVGEGPRTLEEHLARARAPFVQVNLVIALLSLITVPATYLLARRFLQRPWALVATMWMATSVLHLWFSQQGRPHGAAVSFNLLAVLAALRLRRKPVASSYLGMGIAAALAVGALQSGIAVIFPCAVAFLLRDRSVARASPAFALVPLLALAAAGIVFYSSLSPAAGPTSSEAVRTFAVEGSTFRWMGHEIHLDRFDGKGLTVLVGALVSYEPILTAFAVIGAAIGLFAIARGRHAAHEQGRDTSVRDDRLVVLAYAIPYAAAVALYGASTQRFVIPLLPFLACLAAYAMRALSNRAARFGGGARIAATGGILAILGAQAFAASKLSWIRSRPDTAMEAAAWIRTHVRAGTDRIVLSPGYDLPLFTTPKALEENGRIVTNPSQRWLRYQLASVPATAFESERYDLEVLPMVTGKGRKKVLEDPDAYLRDLHAHWFAIEVHRDYDWNGYRLLHEALARNGKLEARFSPDRASRWRDVPIAHHLYDPLPFYVFWFRRILEARCTGAVIEIWKMGT